MSKSIYEYEIKLLGSKQNLQEVANKFIDLCKFVNPSRGYVFETKYFDTDDKILTGAGYSLRYREKQGDFDTSLELKQIAGSENGISKRLEIGVRKNVDLLTLLFNLNAHPSFPQDLKRLPALSELKEQYSTVVERLEQEAVIVLDDKPYIVELALDHIDFMKDGRVLGDESELEFELKSGTADCEKFMKWFKEEVVQDSFVDFTVDSKAYRLQKLLDMAENNLK